MLHGHHFGFPDWILMLFVPPLIGAAIGLRLGRARSRPGLAVVGSSVGGAAGAWLGVALYRLVMAAILGGRDIFIFAAIWIASFLIGAVASGWALSGPRPSATEPIEARGSGCSAVAGLFVTAVGVYLYLLACEPSAFIPIDWRVKYAGIGCMLAGAGILVLGLPAKRTAGRGNGS